MGADASVLIKNKQLFMKKIMLGGMLTAALVMSACSTAPNNNQNNQESKNQNKQTSDYVVDQSDILEKGHLIEGIAPGDIDEQEKAGLILMREEEKLARDVYQVLGEKWDQKVFENIAQSEQSHTDAVKELLDRYEIEDPVKDDAVGSFTSVEMNKLYEQLIEQGDDSLTSALEVGAIVEDLDIKDLQELIEQTDNEDIKIVYENLLRGSKNHMRAFVRNMERNGEKYSPQYINQETYQGIINSEQERGNGMGNGKNR